MAIAMFIAGVAIGSILFAHERRQIESNDAMAAITFQNDVSPIVR